MFILYCIGGVMEKNNVTHEKDDDATQDLAIDDDSKENLTQEEIRTKRLKEVADSACHNGLDCYL